VAKSYQESKAERDAIDSELSAISDKLGAFPRLANGLTPDSVKALPEYRALRSAYDSAFKRLRIVNAEFVKRFKREIKADILARRKAGTYGKKGVES